MARNQHPLPHSLLDTTLTTQEQDLDVIVTPHEAPRTFFVPVLAPTGFIDLMGVRPDQRRRSTRTERGVIW
jgi:hypothetical protein